MSGEHSLLGRQWSPGTGCGAPSLETLKARLDGVPGSLSWWGADLPMAEGVGTGWALMSLPTSAILWLFLAQLWRAFLHTSPVIPFRHILNSWMCITSPGGKKSGSSWNFPTYSPNAVITYISSDRSFPWCYTLQNISNTMKKINITPVCEQTVLPDTFSPQQAHQQCWPTSWGKEVHTGSWLLWVRASG